MLRRVGFGGERRRDRDSGDAMPIGRKLQKLPPLFNKTQRTWIEDQLLHGEDGRRGVLRHIEETYAEPLARWLRPRMRSHHAEPEEFVRQFVFAIVQKPEYFQQWQGKHDADGKPWRLRRWLANGLMLQMRTSDGKVGAEESLDQSMQADGWCTPMASDDAESALEIECIRSMLKAALERARETAGPKLGDHFEMFRRHYLGEESLEPVGASFGLDSKQTWVCVKTALRHVRSAFADVLRRDNVPDEQHEDEIEAMFDALQSGREPVIGMLAAVRQNRDHGLRELLGRLARRDGRTWLERTLTEQVGRLGEPKNIFVERTDIETLERLLKRGEKTAAGAGPDDPAAGAAVRYLAVAAAINHHQRLLIDGAKPETRDGLLEFAESAHEPWREALARAGTHALLKSTRGPSPRAKR